METIETIEDIRKELDIHRQNGKTIGLVPTMGYFHEGHLSLMDIAREKADIVVVSVYVNPTQFAPDEDYDEYPRDIERDENLASKRGVDYIFSPENDEMYDDNFCTYVKNIELTDVLCGASRENHFRGVTTICTKLFNIINPDFAVFGQKDHQQAIIIKRMVKDLNLPLDIVIGDIIREEDGLATSSRNVYLSEEERKQAPIIYESLQMAKEMVNNGERSAEKIIDRVKNKINESKLSKIEYVEIVDGEMLEKVDQVKKGNFLAVAVWFGDTRLIDNIIFED